MKVKDLIAVLQTLDPELMVVADGYEGGLSEVSEVVTTDISLNIHSEWYYGPHEHKDGYLVPENTPTVKAVRILKER